jgi:alpha/beta hydrolase fold
MGEVQFPEYERREALVRTKGYKPKNIEYVCEGHGEPNIILLSGYGVDLEVAWGEIYTALQGSNRVLAYNRLNVGHSTRSKKRQTGEEIVALLRGLLVIAEMQPPYVVVGHSIGGMYAQLFARLHAEEVAGVVLVESAYPGQGDIRSYCKMNWMQAMLFPSISSELAAFEETSRQLQEAPAFPNVPLIVVSSGQCKSDTFVKKQQSLVTLSPQGRQMIAFQSGHNVQNDEPEVVLKAIREILALETPKSYRSYGPEYKKCI